MRMMKKVMTGMSVAALALVIAGGVNAANAGAAGSATVNGQTQIMKVKGEGKEIFVSYDAVKDVKGTLTLNAKAKWDVYNGSSANVDLSAVKMAKDTYIAVKDDSDDARPRVYKFNADARKLTGKYGMVAATKTSTITFTDEKKAEIKVTEETAPILEYRTEKANAWTKYNGDDGDKLKDMNMYEKQGSTLYFRYAGTETVTFNAAVGDNKEDAEKSTYFLLTQKAGNFASTEIKVKVGKEANAPSATIDYDKGTFKVKAATMECRNLVGGEYVYTKINSKAEDPKEGSFIAPEADLVPIDITKDGVFEVRTAATDKKIASKVGVYAYKGTPNLKADRIKLTMTAAKDAKGVINVTFKNEDAVSYLVYDKDPSKETKPKAIATIKAKTDKAYKDVVAKNVAADTKLWVVSASDKKAGVFRSNALEWEAVKVAEAPAATDAPVAE